MTDHSPLERAARALCKASGDDWGREGPLGLKEIYETQAKAVLLAIREPTMEMIAAGDHCQDQYAPDIWQAMIDSALEIEK